MVKYEIGDVVKIVHPGATYDTYYTMFEKLNFKNKSKNGSFNIGNICTIFAIERMHKPNLYGLRYGDKECLVSAKAFILVKKKNTIFELW